MKEKWKDMEESLYVKISNHGRFKIFSRSGKLIRITDGSIDADSYRVISVGGKTRRVHILVAKYYLTNIKNKPLVHHIDGDKSNNRVDNLQYVDHSENKLLDISIKKHVSKHNPIGQFLDGKLIAIYKNSKIIEKIIGINASSIRKTISNDNRKSLHGFQWKHVKVKMEDMI